MKPPDALATPPWLEHSHRVVFALFVLSWAAALGNLLELPAFKAWNWSLVYLLLFGAATTFLNLSRTLPAQNVLLVTALIMVIAGGVHTLGVATGLPFGAYVYTDAAGKKLFGALPWAIPFLWLTVVLNCRGVARLILRPWRKTKTYGFRVIGLTCMLAAVFDLGLEPLAAYITRFWMWTTPASVPDWYSAPWVNFFAWSIVTLLMLAVATPWLIHKKPTRRPPDYLPLIIWNLGMTLFAAVCAAQQLWPAAILDIAAVAVITFFAIRGAQW